MTTKTNQESKPEQKKAPYAKPKLVLLGTVRELTGSQAGSTSEAGFPNTKP